MSDLKTTYQGHGNVTHNDAPKGETDEKNSARVPNTAGTDHDTDKTGNSINQGHGHPRDEHGSNQ
jgi:hypothetical protein